MVFYELNKSVGICIGIDSGVIVAAVKHCFQKTVPTSSWSIRCENIDDAKVIAAGRAVQDVDCVGRVWKKSSILGTNKVLKLMIS